MNNPSQAEADALLQMYGTKKCQRRTVVLTPNEVEDCKKEIEKERLKEEEEKRQQEKRRINEKKTRERAEKIRQEELKLKREKIVNEAFDKIQIYVYPNKSKFYIYEDGITSEKSECSKERLWDSIENRWYNPKINIKKIIYFGSHKSTFHPYKIYWENGNIKEEGVYFKHLNINDYSLSSVEEIVKRNRDYFSRTDSLGPKAYAFKKTYDKNGNLTYSQDDRILSTISSSFQKEIEEKTILLDTFVAKNTYLELKYPKLYEYSGYLFFSVDKKCNVEVRELSQYQLKAIVDDKDFKFPSLEEMKKIISELKEN
ncbi:hypothetical protein OAS41_01570 [Candidatus Marinimicrobia bacterium]|nr:hypothetical protein [Candidatus Neomarinimicrobiota bacterium]